MDGNKLLDLAEQVVTSFFYRKNALKADFERVAIPHLPSLYTAALYLTRDEHAAEDLVQETYLRAYRFFHKFEAGTNCRAWLLSIQRHLFINSYRQRKTEPEFLDWEKIDQDYELFAVSEKTNSENGFSSGVMGPEVEKALRELPEEFRTAIVLVDIEELTYEEAAQVIGCPIGTVRSRLSRGRRILQLALKDYALERGLNRR